jgi:hypothetical protein
MTSDDLGPARTALSLLTAAVSLGLGGCPWVWIARLSPRFLLILLRAMRHSKASAVVRLPCPPWRTLLRLPLAPLLAFWLSDSVRGCRRYANGDTGSGRSDCKQRLSSSPRHAISSRNTVSWARREWTKTQGETLEVGCSSPAPRCTSCMTPQPSNWRTTWQSGCMRRIRILHGRSMLKQTTYSRDSSCVCERVCDASSRSDAGNAPVGSVRLEPVASSSRTRFKIDLGPCQRRNCLIVAKRCLPGSPCCVPLVQQTSGVPTATHIEAGVASRRGGSWSPRASGPGRDAQAAGGHLRVVRPEALPAGGGKDRGTGSNGDLG